MRVRSKITACVLVSVAVPFFANNGIEGAIATPSVAIETIRVEGEKRFGGRCGGTAIEGEKARVLTAAHCFIPLSLVERMRAKHRAAIEEIDPEVRRAALNVAVTDFDREVRALRDYSEIAISGPEGQRIVIRPGVVKVHPGHLLALLLSKQGTMAAFDLAWVETEIPEGVERAVWITKRAELDRFKPELHGYGKELEPVIPVKGDFDRDGVVNQIDRCPLTPAGLAVNAVGCGAGDREESYKFRHGRHADGFTLGRYPKAFVMGGDELAMIDLHADRMVWSDERNTMPGKGDSGSGLLDRWDGRWRIAGVYQGAFGPRASDGGVSWVARYESVLPATVRNWLNESP